MKKLTTIALLGLAISHTDAWAWGQTGHRVTGKIAENYLSQRAQEEIQKLYPDASLAEISTFADEERSNASAFWRFTAGPWHYVTVPEGKTYPDVGAPEKGDALTALAQFAKTLKDPKAKLEDKQLALHFSVHIIGDLHQPLHAGNGTDKGGNDEKVEFFWEESNLHRVWDSGMIDRQQLSYTEWSDWLGRKISNQQVTDMAKRRAFRLDCGKHRLSRWFVSRQQGIVLALPISTLANS